MSRQATGLLRLGSVINKERKPERHRPWTPGRDKANEACRHSLLPTDPPVSMGFDFRKQAARSYLRYHRIFAGVKEFLESDRAAPSADPLQEEGRLGEWSANEFDCRSAFPPVLPIGDWPMALIYADERFLDHETGQHPESPARLRAVYDHLAKTGLRQRLTEGTPQAAPAKGLESVHSQAYVARVRQTAEQGGGRLDPDTVVSPRSYDVARNAVGAALDAVDRVLEGSHRRAVCLVRPPGHHALPGRGMGFCLFNNVALAARHAESEHGLNRILIVDWDVHHGNGTQDVFYRSESVYFFSAHRYPFYPGTGSADETGAGPGDGTVFNLPLAFGISRSDYRHRFADMLHEAADRCRPQLVLISAGFDAHTADPIGSLGLETEDFGDLTQMVLDVAGQYCEGRIVSLLEGGYDLTALAESVACHLETLLAAEDE